MRHDGASRLTPAQAVTQHPPRPPRAPTAVDYRPVTLELQLPAELRNPPEFATREAMFKQWGFNLKRSNEMPLHTQTRDVRSSACKAEVYPPAHEMPQVSVVIIFYNEAMSTLLRNVVGVLNRSPPDLLGEIVMVNDNSSIAQLDYLEEHLDRLPPAARAKIRLFKRKMSSPLPPRSPRRAPTADPQSQRHRRRAEPRGGGGALRRAALPGLARRSDGGVAGAARGPDPRGPHPGGDSGPQVHRSKLHHHQRRRGLATVQGQLQLATLLHHRRRHHGAGRARSHQAHVAGALAHHAGGALCDGPQVLLRARRVRSRNSVLRGGAHRAVVQGVDVRRFDGADPLLAHRAHLPRV